MSVKIGMMSLAHMHTFAYANAVQAIAGAEIAGVADNDAARGRQGAEKFGVPYYDSYAALLKADIDAVIVGSENVRHGELVEMAAGAGKHILCEKPLATNLADGRAMLEVCKRANVQLMTAFPCRFSPALGRLKASFDAGKVGSALALRGTNRGRCPFGWFTDIAMSGGGAVIDHTVHVVDIMRWLLRREVTSVYAEISNGMNHQEFDDTGFLTMEFEGGVFATLDTSWSRPKSFPTWGDVTLAVVGERGVLSLDMFAQNLTVYSDKTGGVSWKNWGSDIDYLLVESFVDSVAAGTPVAITGEDGLRAASVALAAYQSARTGQPVPVEAI